MLLLIRQMTSDTLEYRQTAHIVSYNWERSRYSINSHRCVTVALSDQRFCSTVRPRFSLNRQTRKFAQRHKLNATALLATLGSVCGTVPDVGFYARSSASIPRHAAGPGTTTGLRISVISVCAIAAHRF